MGQLYEKTSQEDVASGHMKEHAMIASDYAIKAIELIYFNDRGAITLEPAG